MTFGGVGNGAGYMSLGLPMPVLEEPAPPAPPCAAVDEARSPPLPPVLLVLVVVTSTSPQAAATKAKRDTPPVRKNLVRIGNSLARRTHRQRARVYTRAARAARALPATPASVGRQI